MRRPLCVVAAILLAHTAAMLFLPAGMAVAIPAFGGIAYIFLYRKKDQRAFSLFLCFLVGSIISLAAVQLYLLRLEQFRRLEGRSLAFHGYVSQASSYNPDVVTIFAQTADGSQVLRLTAEPGGPEAGDLVQGTIHVLEARTDPDGFFLSGGVVLYGRQEGHLTLWKDGRMQLLWKALNLRQTMYNRLTSALPGENGAVLGGMLFSLRDKLPEELNSRLNDAGLGHLLAVSGLHLSVWSGLLLTICRKASAGKGLTFLLSGAGVGIIAFAAGFSPSVLRAGIMMLLYLAAEALGRKSDSFTSLALAASIITCIYPPVLGELSFQLSFCATLSILLFAGPLTRWFLDRWVTLRGGCGTMGRSLANVLGVCCAAQIGSLPILGFTNGYIPLFSLPGNLLASPLVFPALVLGMLGAVFLLAGWETLAGGILFLAGYPVGAILAIARFIWILPFRRIAVCFPWQRALLCLWAAASAAAVRIRLRKNRRTLLKLCAAVSILAWILFSAAQAGGVLVVSNAQAKALSVTRGDSTLLVYDSTSRGDYEANMLTDMLSRSGLAAPDEGFPFRGGVVTGLPITQWLPGINAGMPHTYATLVEVDGIKLLKFWAGYDIINRYDSRSLWEEADIIADLDWNLYAANPEIKVIRRLNGDQMIFLNRGLLRKGENAGAASKLQKAGR